MQHALNFGPAFRTIRQARARITDPETSHQAAASVRDMSRTQEIILNILKMRGPMTDEQIFEQWDMNISGHVSPSGLRSRRAELVRQGLVHNTGLTQANATGRKCTIWSAA